MTSGKTHRYALSVVGADLDNLGHVNNARYLDYLERGRTTWYHEQNLFTDAARLNGLERVETVVVNIGIDFRSECLVGEALTVETRPERSGSKSFAVAQRILKADGTVAAEAVVTSVAMDMASRRAVALPESFRALFDNA